MNIKIYHIHFNIIEAGGEKNATNHSQGTTPPTTAKDARLTGGDAELLAKLKPIFFGIAEDAEDFLRRIKGSADRQITRLVTRLVEEKKLSDVSCKGILWQVLHDHGLYKAGRKNWNSMVNPRMHAKK